MKANVCGEQLAQLSASASLSGQPLPRFYTSKVVLVELGNVIHTQLYIGQA